MKIKVYKGTNEIGGNYVKLLSCRWHTGLILRKLDELGLYACDFTLEEIGNILDVTRERVRQIETSAIKKLKNPKLGRGLKKYLDM